MKNIAIQLYSLREEPDLAKQLEGVAKIGYSGVEFAGYHDKSAAEMKKLLDANGLAAVSSHVGLGILRENLRAEIEYNLALGNTNIICPSTPTKAPDKKNMDNVLALSEEFNRFGEVCKSYGATFGIHNHAHELAEIDGKRIIDIFMENTDPALVKAQVDVFWVAYAGVDVMAFLEQYKSRIPMIHVKELENMETKANVTVGKGVIDFAEIYRRYPNDLYIVEQEQVEAGVGIWDSLKMGHEHLAGI